MKRFEVTLIEAGCRPEYVDVDTLAEAAYQVVTFQDLLALGASGLEAGHGVVRHKGTYRVVARISYNGRIWPEAAAADLLVGS